MNTGKVRVAAPSTERSGERPDPAPGRPGDCQCGRGFKFRVTVTVSGNLKFKHWQ